MIYLSIFLAAIIGGLLVERENARRDHAQTQRKQERLERIEAFKQREHLFGEQS